MADDRIEGLRTTQFPTERRGGYDRAAVDDYLAGMADWLESDDAKATIAKREIAQVGERTGAIITAAQEGAEKILSEARAEVGKLRADAERETTEQRAAADAHAAEVRAAAETDAEGARAEAAEHAKLTIREADERLERAARQAEERTAGVENEIADLAQKRDQLVANLESLVAGIRTAIDGPGSEDLGLPERSRTAAAFTDEPIAHPEVADAAPFPVEEPAEEVEAPGEVEEPAGAIETVTEHRLIEPEPVAEPEEIVEPEPVVEPESGEEEVVESAEASPLDETRPLTAEFDTDEELYEDEHPPDPIPSGRDPARRPPRDSPDDPPTDDQKLTELL